MVNNLSYVLIHGLLAEAGIKVVPDTNGTLLTLRRANDEFPHHVVIRYIVKNFWLHLVGQASGYDVPQESRQDVMVALNLHNMRHHGCVGALHNDTVMFKYSLLVDRPVSMEYVLENGVKSGTESIWKAFVEFDKNMKDDEGNYKRYTLPVIG